MENKENEAPEHALGPSEVLEKYMDEKKKIDLYNELVDIHNVEHNRGYGFKILLYNLWCKADDQNKALIAKGFPTFCDAMNMRRRPNGIPGWLFGKPFEHRDFESESQVGKMITEVYERNQVLEEENRILRVKLEALQDPNHVDVHHLQLGRQQ